MRCDDLALGFAPCDLGLGHLALQFCLTPRRFDRRLALLLGGAVLCLALRLHGFNRRFRLNHARLQYNGVEIANAFKVRIVLRQHDACHIELRDSKTVFCEALVDLLMQLCGDQLELFIDLKDVDLVILDDRTEVCLDRARDHRAERRLQ